MILSILGETIGVRMREELMDSTAFVASCLVISMIAAQNTSRREGVKGAVGLIKGSGNSI